MARLTRLVVALGIVAALMGLASVAIAQYSSPGYLVVAPGNPEIGDEVQVVGLNISPDEPLHGIEWTYHFSRRGVPCDNSGGTAHGDDTGTYVILTACHTGTSTITLFVVETAQVVEEQTVVIAERSPPSRPNVHIRFADGRPKIRPRIPVAVSVTFSEPVTGFDRSDITVENGAVGELIDGDGETFTYEVWATGMASVVVNVGEGVAHSVRAELPNREAWPFDMPMSYDDDRDSAINSGEVLAAVGDYFKGLITTTEVLEIVRLFFQGPIPENDRCPWFNEDDTQDYPGYTVISLSHQLETDVEKAIEEELDKSGAAELFTIDDDTDLTAELYGEVLGSHDISPVTVEDDLRQYGHIRVQFTFDGGQQEGVAGVWITERATARRCVPTQVALELPPSPQ